jgi:hypothetical protein
LVEWFETIGDGQPRKRRRGRFERLREDCLQFECMLWLIGCGTGYDISLMVGKRAICHAKGAIDESFEKLFGEWKLMHLVRKGNECTVMNWLKSLFLRRKLERWRF